MRYSTIFEDMIHQKMMDMHTAYIAKVISTNGKTAKIQPLGNVKAYGEKAKKQSPLSSVPIINSARYKIKPDAEDKAVLTPIKAGDVVLVICCERNITEAKKGVNSTPVIGHHSMSDSVIVGIL